MDIMGSLSSAYAADMYNTVKKDNIETESFKERLKSDDDKELKNACVEFESYFLKMMLKAMRDTVDTSDSFLQKSQGEKIFQDMLDDEYCKSAARGKGVGLAQMMYKQLSKSGRGVTFEQIQNGEG